MGPAAGQERKRAARSTVDPVAEDTPGRDGTVVAAGEAIATPGSGLEKGVRTSKLCTKECESGFSMYD